MPSVTARKIMNTGTGVSITVGLEEHADEVTEWELAYEEDTPDPVKFVDGSTRTPVTGPEARTWTLKLKGARDELPPSLYDYLWANDGSLGDFQVTDQGALYGFTALIKPAPPKTTAGDPTMFEVELDVDGQPARTAPVAGP
jgi:hypothetical protein